MSLGHKDSPFSVAPDDWETNGVPYGAFCKCAKCGFVGRSTFTFDYFADGPGLPLDCERCYIGTPKRVAEIIDAEIKSGNIDADELPEEER